MKLSVIIPCFNEKLTIETIVNKVVKFDLYEKEIIIIDDCSTDSSKDIIKDFYMSHYGEKNSLEQFMGDL